MSTYEDSLRRKLYVNDKILQLASNYTPPLLTIDQTESDLVVLQVFMTFRHLMVSVL